MVDFLAEFSPEVNQNGGEFRFATKTMAPYEIASKAGFDFRMITYRNLYTDSQELKGKLNTTLVLERLQMNMVADATNNWWRLPPYSYLFCLKCHFSQKLPLHEMKNTKMKLGRDCQLFLSGSDLP